jgi:phenylalanyl-tRNA synthetase beta chain
MPTIDIDYAEFEAMLGIKFQKDLDKLNDVLAYAKGEAKLFDEKNGTISIEIKDTNRPDLWNIEGLVRSLRGFLCLDKTAREYKTGKQLTEVFVDEELKTIRPFIGCSIIKNVGLADAIIRGLMQLQDKLDQTYGRNRRRASIGLYDFDLITPPLYYAVAKPTEVSFVPLGFDKKISLAEILKEHPKGIEYGHIVNKHPVYPVLWDAQKKVLSFPPIINSNDLGRVTEKTKNILVEVTGTNQETVLNTLTIVTLSLIDRGGRAHSAKIHYPHEKLTVMTPNFQTKLLDLSMSYACKVLGLELTAKQVTKLLSKAGFKTKKVTHDKVTVQVPSYRIDVMHQVDLVEDIAISYDYNKIKPLWRRLPTTGGTGPEQALLDTTRELMVGLGFQEVLTYTITSVENLFTKMNLKKQEIVEIANPKVQTLTCLRNWLLPSLMEFLSNNLHIEYPQKIFELDNVTVPDRTKETRSRDRETLAAVISHANASFTEIKSAADSLFMNLGLEWDLKATDHPSFIPGRVGKVIVHGNEIGTIGEIHPKILESWTLENPVAAFELDMEKVVKIKNGRKRQAR